MIIRPVCKKSFVALPNALFNDRRLSADTRAMIALLLSKPRGWELRPAPLAKLLSRAGGKPVGWSRLSRMFGEATEAGYMARSAEQAHNEDGTWGRYDYFVGMPEDVAQAIKKAGVAVAPLSHQAYTDQAHAADRGTNHKEQSQENTDSINSSHQHDQSPQLGAVLPKRLPIKSELPASRVRSGQEVVQHRVAVRLGLGDAMQGWLLFGALCESRRDTLTALERSGNLRDDDVMAARASADLTRAQVGRAGS